MSNYTIQEMEDHIAFLEAENKKLREENAKLKNSHVKHKKSNSSWQYEMDHKDDWRTIHEMGSL
jgi:hypothetical protein